MTRSLSGLTPDQPIGLFDSGVGGLSVAAEIRRQLPRERMVYYADCGRAPWGVRSADDVRAMSEGIARYLIGRGAKIVVAACNTASVHALAHLRTALPEVRFVGIVPAVKPATLLTRTGKIGVLVTSATATGDYLAGLLEQFVYPTGAEAVVCVPHGLVQQIERGEPASEETRRILTECLTPMLERGVDVVALGCTHYPFAAEMIGEVSGGRLLLINPAPAVAAQCGRVLLEMDLLNDGPEFPDWRGMEVLTSGEAEQTAAIVCSLLGSPVVVCRDDALAATPWAMADAGPAAAPSPTGACP